MDEITFRATPERFQGLKIGVQRKLGQDFGANVRYLAHFMVDEDGEWLDEDDALAILDEHTRGELGEMYDQLNTAIEDGIVPKE